MSVSEDTVYMPLEAERKEYVLEKFGKIYRGTFRSIFPTSWDFGQVLIGLFVMAASKFDCGQL